MPKKRGARKSVRKKSVSSTQIYVGVFVIVLLLILVGFVPTAKVISGNAVRLDYTNSVSGDLNVVVDGEKMTFKVYAEEYCEGRVCTHPNDEACVPGICAGLEPDDPDFIGPYNSDFYNNGGGDPDEFFGEDGRSARWVFGTTGFFDEFLTDWEEGTFDERASKYLAFFLLLILVSTILNTASFPSNAFFRFLFSLILTFLSVAYITPAEIYGLMQTYSAMGMALISIIPFIVLVFFSASIFKDDKEDSPRLKKTKAFGAVLLQRMLWFSFAMFLLYKLIFVFITLGAGAYESWAPLVILVMSFGAALLFAIENNAFLKVLWKTFRDTTFMTTKMKHLRDAIDQEAGITGETKVLDK